MNDFQLVEYLESLNETEWVIVEALIPGLTADKFHARKREAVI